MISLQSGRSGNLKCLCMLALYCSEKAPSMHQACCIPPSNAHRSEVNFVQAVVGECLRKKHHRFILAYKNYSDFSLVRNVMTREFARAPCCIRMAVRKDTSTRMGVLTTASMSIVDSRAPMSVVVEL